MGRRRERRPVDRATLDPLATTAFAEDRPSRWRVLWHHALASRTHWRLVVGTSAGAALLAAVVCVFLPSRYTAIATVRVVDDGTDPARRTASVERLTSLAEEVAALGSRALAAEVIRALGLERDTRFLAANPGPGFLVRTVGLLRRPFRARGAAPAPAVAPSDDDGDPSDAVATDVPAELVRAYRSALRISPIRRSGRVEVRFTSASPELAQQIADAHATEYLRRTLQARFAPTGAARALLERETERSAGEARAAKDALAAFRASYPDVAGQAGDEATRGRLLDLARKVGEAEASRISAEADDRLVKQRSYDALPAVAADPVIRTLRAEVERLRARQTEVSERTDADGLRKDAAADLRQARTRLQREIGRAVGGIESALLDAQGREAALRSQLARQEDALGPASPQTAALRLEATEAAAEALDAKLRARIDTAAGATGDGGAALEPAAVPTRPSEPHVLLDLFLAALAGLIAGFLAAVALELRPRALRTPDDVQALLRLPTLGVVPDFCRVGRAAVAPEVYRGLRTSVLFLDPTRPPRTLVVTSAAPGDGKTATVVNLGLSLAGLGMRVLVVDADLENPAVHHALGLAPATGLAEVIRGTATFDDTVRAAGAPGGGTLRVLLAGTSGTSDLLATPRTRKLLRQLGERHDVVLIDSPAAGPLLAPLADGVILVVAADDDATGVRAAIERLRQLRCRLVGVVLNRVDPDADYYRAYAYPFAA